MKKLSFLLLLSYLAITGLSAQDTVHTQYAILEIRSEYTRAYIIYDDGRGGLTRDTINMTWDQYEAQAEFQCFHYLNDRGYELVNIYGNGAAYLFQRRKK